MDTDKNVKALSHQLDRPINACARLSLAAHVGHDRCPAKYRDIPLPQVIAGTL